MSGNVAVRPKIVEETAAAAATVASGGAPGTLPIGGRSGDDGVIDIAVPLMQTAPVVFSSPHSGRDYPAAFVAGARLDPETLRRSEDCYVDEIFADVPDCGAPLLRALFPRAYVDPNREPYELDPRMFSEVLPAYVNGKSPRVAAGLGTVARVVASGAEIYDGKLCFEEVRQRIEALYRPYHAALADLIDATRERFKTCVLIDCHSMPSICGPAEHEAGRRRRADMILGDGNGTTCAPGLMAMVEQHLTHLGYTVARNAPYSGGFITRHYGRPKDGVHALQVELNRALYMDERTLERAAGMDRLRRDMVSLAQVLCDIGTEELAA